MYNVTCGVTIYWHVHWVNEIRNKSNNYQNWKWNEICYKCFTNIPHLAGFTQHIKQIVILYYNRYATLLKNEKLNFNICSRIILKLFVYSSIWILDYAQSTNKHPIMVIAMPMAYVVNTIFLYLWFTESNIKSAS